MGNLPDEFKNLNKDDQTRVLEFICENIESAYIERNSYNTESAYVNSHDELIMNDGDFVQFIDHDFEEFWCRNCKDYIGSSTRLMVWHVMIDLGLI